MPTPEPGTVVGGKYRIVRALGEGGMGTVFEAENVLTLNRAAIKWLHPQLGAHEHAYQRVIHEARAASRIHHRNVVDVYDILREGDSICLVMELLIGEPLAALLTRASLPVHELLALLVPAMRGTAAAHAAGVVHRDVKPDNIFLAREPGSPEPVPKLIDFGISKVFDAESANPTRSGITMGTPKYVSYEQLVGARDVDGRTDIYAFGVIVYEALTGRAPYDEARTFGEQAIRFATSIPPAPRALRPEIPEPLAELVCRAIEKERAQRLASMDEFVQALEPFAKVESYPAPLSAFPQLATELPPGAVPAAQTTTPLHPTPALEVDGGGAGQGAAASLRPARERRGPRTRVLLAGLAAVLALGGAIASWWPGRRQAERSLATLPLAGSGRETRDASAEPSTTVRKPGFSPVLSAWADAAQTGPAPAAEGAEGPPKLASENAASAAASSPASVRAGSDAAAPAGGESASTSTAAPKPAPARATGAKRASLPRPRVEAQDATPAPNIAASAQPVPQDPPGAEGANAAGDEGTHRAGRLRREEF